MKIIRDSLKAVFDRWEDSGQYPSNAGAGPLPPGPWYVSEVEGELVVELTPDELASAIIVGWDEFVAEETDGIDLPDGVLSVAWQVDSINRFSDERPEVYDPWIITFTCTECEPDQDYSGPDGPDEREY